jgi:sirohydrochlorin cobaltochelatase
MTTRGPGPVEGIILEITMRKTVIRPLLASLAALALVMPARAQTGLLIVAHGAGPSWNGPVRAVVQQVRWTQGLVATAFLMGPEADSSGWGSGVAALRRGGAKQIVVVPLLVSSHGGHYREILYYAGAVSEPPPDLGGHQHPAANPPDLPMRVTPALDAAPELGAALLERWRSLDSANRRRPLLLVAHGPNSDEEAALWIKNLEVAAARLREAGGVPVTVGLLRDDAPAPVRAAAVADLRNQIRRLAEAAHDSVAVLPVLISSGEIDQVRIPDDLAGLPIRYAALPLAPLAPLALWIERIALAKPASSP